MGDHRLADFSSVSHAAYVDHSALPVAPPMSSEQVRDMYEYAQSRVNHAQVELMEQMLREKINQRTRSGGFALKRAFAFFDRDGSGGVSAAELRQGLRDFGLQYTDEEVGALMAKHDQGYRNEVDYYSFVDHIMKDSWTGQ
eukprot:TRINITY_DN3104_c0_g1_i10.p1 TRINITY_DN3104_c0_g1~~TRINITY_DN3104_c0_g1_i10.p1  ORF type:complete len:141 (+),score=40.69 TRINITY_DN3104_c0_g1_i10:881-1303(+)